MAKDLLTELRWEVHLRHELLLIVLEPAVQRTDHCTPNRSDPRSCTVLPVSFSPAGPADEPDCSWLKPRKKHPPSTMGSEHRAARHQLSLRREMHEERGHGNQPSAGVCKIQK